jgi:hypothetical protein
MTEHNMSASPCGVSMGVTWVGAGKRGEILLRYFFLRKILLAAAELKTSK